jgi:hypothetical protein
LPPEFYMQLSFLHTSCIPQIHRTAFNGPKAPSEERKVLSLSLRSVLQTAGFLLFHSYEFRTNKRFYDTR